MDRAATLAALIAFDRPLAEIEAALDALEPVANPVATLRRGDIVAIIHRFQAGALDATEIARRANLVECRDDLDFERRHEEAVADALFDLGNPDEQGDLGDIADDILAALES